MGTDDPGKVSGRPFLLRDCALIALATGKKASSLQEFRREIAEVPATSIYHHFWGTLLQPRYDEREYNNDFAAWARHAIHDGVLAERLATLDPAAFSDLEDLRVAIVDVIEERVGDDDHLAWTRATREFQFLSSQIVTFDTHRRLCVPADLGAAAPDLTISTVFYHFVDARRRTKDGRDDFSAWLAGFGDEQKDLRRELAAVDPYFGSLTDLRNRLVALFIDRLANGAS